MIAPTPSLIRCTTDPSGISLRCKVVLPSLPNLREDWIPFQVDTGSQSTRICEPDAIRLGFRYEGLKRNGIGASGITKGETVDYTIPGAYLVMRDEMGREVSALFERGLVFQRNGDKNLLGWDYLSNHKFNYNRDGFTIEV